MDKKVIIETKMSKKNCIFFFCGGPNCSIRDFCRYMDRFLGTLKEEDVCVWFPCQLELCLCSSKFASSKNKQLSGMADDIALVRQIGLSAIINIYDQSVISSSNSSAVSEVRHFN